MIKEVDDGNKRLTLSEKRKKVAENKKKKKKKGKSPTQSELDNLLAAYQNERYDVAEGLAVIISKQFPHYSYGWKILGAILEHTGKKPEALNAMERSVQLDPKDAQAHNNLGVALHARGSLEEAETSYRQALALKPSDAEVYYNLGSTLKALERLAEAEENYRQAITLRPDYAHAHNNLGVTLHELGKFEEAEASCRQAIILQFNYPDAHTNLGVELLSLGRLEEAAESLRQAITLEPAFAKAHLNMGITLQELGRFKEAEASCGQAIALQPDYSEAKFRKSLLLLNRQEFQLGWSSYYPPRSSNYDVISGYFTERAMRWKGTPLQGKNIQVYGTQGVGDEILFSSCIPDLIQESPKSIHLECDPRLEPLFARSFPEVTVCGGVRTRRPTQAYDSNNLLIENVPFDYSIPIDGLPQFFRNKIEDFPRRDAFLVPDPESVDKWNKRLDRLGNGLKIGVSWLAGDANLFKTRSIPLANWGNLLSVDAFFVNLQYGDTSDEVAQFSAENSIKIYDWEDNNALLDLDNQAALISTLDLVITVDNTTVHSSIALGKEVWNLLDPSLNLRWMDNGTGISPLSRHLRLFKKKNQDSWNAVLGDVEEQLREKINA